MRFKMSIISAVLAFIVIPVQTIFAEEPDELWESYYSNTPMEFPSPLLNPLGPGQGFLAKEPSLSQLYSTGGDEPLNFSDNYGDNTFSLRGCISLDSFGAVWFGHINIGGGSPLAAGNVTFGLHTDDEGVIWIDGELILSTYYGAFQTTTINLSDGQHEIIIGFHEGGGGAYIRAKFAQGSNIAFEDLAFIHPGAPSQAGLWSAAPWLGSGNEADPYKIATVTDLLNLGADPNYYDKHFILLNDVNLTGHTFNKAVISPDTNPSGISFEGTPFTGVFDSGSHKITGLVIDGNDYVGLFGVVGSGGQINDLGVECSVSGDLSVGGLVGWNYGTVSNCYATGTVSGDDDYVGGLVGVNCDGTVSNCYSSGSVSGTDYVGGLVGGNSGGGDVSNCYTISDVSGNDYVGGLVGDNQGNILQCHSQGNVSASNTSTVYGEGGVGGLVGFNNGDISECYSIGSVGGQAKVGGLVGNNDYGIPSGYISNCYASGSVEGTDDFVGGLVGHNDEGASMSNCYSTGFVNGVDHVGGLVGGGCASCVSGYWDVDTSGKTTSAGGAGLTHTQMQQQSSFAGWDFDDVWRMPYCVGYPVLRCFGGLGGSGTIENPYRIGTAAELIEVGQNTCLYDANFVLTNDIDMGGQVFDRAIIAPDTNPSMQQFQGMYFTGVFDGNDHKITGLVTDGNDYVGLFGFVLGGQIKDLGVEGSVNGDRFVGGLMGYTNSGSVLNCYSTGDVSTTENAVGGLAGGSFDADFSECHSTCFVSGNEDVGGLLGYITNGTNVSNCHSTGDVTGENNVGGLAGKNYDGNISDCYSTGSVGGDDYVGGLVGYSHSGSLSNCYSTGAVSGDEYVGGLTGYNDYGSVSSCYSTGRTDGTNWVGGLVGYLTGNNEYGDVLDSYSLGDVNGLGNCVGGLVGTNDNGTISGCFASGRIERGVSAVGGLVGENFGEVSDCYARGGVNGGYYVGGLMGYVHDCNVYNCYSIGDVNGVSYTGGLAGLIMATIPTTVANSFWDVNSQTHGLTGSNSIGLNGGGTLTNVAGHTTVQMRTASIYTGWDIGDDSLWSICEPTNYPRFYWQIPAWDYRCPDGCGFEDYSVLAGKWQMEDAAVNLAGEAIIDFEDMMAFCENWLVGR